VGDALLAGRWVLALILAGAGAAKVLGSNRRRRIDAVRRYAVVPEALVMAVALTLPWLELVLGGLLAVGVQVAITSALAGVMLSTFAVAVGCDLLLGHSFDCGCGAEVKTIGWTLVVRDLALGGLAAMVVFGPGSGLALWPGWDADRPSEPSAQLIAIPMLVIIWVVGVRLVGAWSSLRRADRSFQTVDGF
jgi:hypothetical protein